MPKDFEPFNWNDETKIDCRAPDGSDEAKFSQSRIMGNLLKALKLKIEEKDFNSQESEVIEFVKHYYQNEQCFGYTEIFKNNPGWIISVWGAVGSWDGNNLDDLRNILKEKNIPRRFAKKEDILDEVILLLVEGYKRHGLSEDVPIPKLISIEIEEDDFEVNSLGQITGRLDLKGLIEIFSKIKEKKQDCLIEVSTGFHSTVARFNQDSNFLAFDPDHPEAFLDKADEEEAAEFLWSSLSRRQEYASIDVDVFSCQEFEIFPLGDCVKLAESTLNEGILEDLFQIFLYNDKMSEYLIKLLKKDNYKQLTGVNAVSGSGGESWEDVLNSLKERLSKDLVSDLERATVPALSIDDPKAESINTNLIKNNAI